MVIFLIMLNPRILPSVIFYCELYSEISIGYKPIYSILHSLVTSAVLSTDKHVIVHDKFLCVWVGSVGMLIQLCWLCSGAQLVVLGKSYVVLVFDSEPWLQPHASRTLKLRIAHQISFSIFRRSYQSKFVPRLYPAIIKEDQKC